MHASQQHIPGFLTKSLLIITDSFNKSIAAMARNAVPCQSSAAVNVSLAS
jgi:hypothetical protein